MVNKNASRAGKIITNFKTDVFKIVQQVPPHTLYLCHASFVLQPAKLVMEFIPIIAWNAKIWIKHLIMDFVHKNVILVINKMAIAWEITNALIKDVECVAQADFVMNVYLTMTVNLYADGSLLYQLLLCHILSSPSSLMH